MLNMKGPKSYTGEDTIEIDCHGGVLMMKRILQTVLQAGARPAEPGEFTKKAFLNGRIDLSQAEAVRDGPRSFIRGFTCLALLWILPCQLIFRVLDFHLLWFAFPNNSTKLVESIL